MKFIQTIIGFIILSALIYGVYYLGKVTHASIFSQISKDLQAIILVVSVLVMASVLLCCLTLRHKTQSNLTCKQRKNKTLVYNELISFYSKILSQESPPHEEISDFLSDITGKLLTTASEQVLKCFYQLRSSENSQQAVRAFASLILAIRHDLGFANETVGEREIMALFVPDVEKLMQK